MKKYLMLLIVFLGLCPWVMGQGIDLKDVRYSPGKVTRGEKVSYKGIRLDHSKTLYVVNTECRDTAALTTYWKDGREIESFEGICAEWNFEESDVRAVLHDVFTLDELDYFYRNGEPAFLLSITFDVDGNAQDIFFMMDYDDESGRYTPFLSIDPDRLYEFEKRLKQVYKLKKDSSLEMVKNFKAIFTIPLKD